MMENATPNRKRSDRPNKGQPPIRFPDGVPEFAEQVEDMNRQGAGANYEPQVYRSDLHGNDVDPNREDDQESTTSSTRNNTKKKELKKLQLQLAEVEMKQLKLKMELLEDSESEDDYQDYGGDEEEEGGDGKKKGEQEEREATKPASPNGRGLDDGQQAPPNRQQESKPWTRTTANFRPPNYSTPFRPHQTPMGHYRPQQRQQQPVHLQHQASQWKNPPQQHYQPQQQWQPSQQEQQFSGQVDPMVSTVLQALQDLPQALNQQHISNQRFFARQGGNSKLPTFTGNPLDWPLFYNHYVQSTHTCGFDAAQNMSRLEKAIQGEARKSVSALMIIPTNSELVIRTLQRRFGRPEYVISALVDLAKKTPPPKEDKLSTLVDYANNLNNLVTTVKALNVPAHLYNPTLITELVNKLPAHYRVLWGQYVLTNPNGVTLEDLARWVDGVADAVSVVEVPGFKRRDGRAKDDVSATTVDEPSKERKCKAYDEPGHNLGSCKQFKNLPVEDRWKFVKKHNMCWSCLTVGHVIKECRRKKDCNTNECKKKHHPLLHENSARRDSDAPAQRERRGRPRERQNSPGLRERDQPPGRRERVEAAAPNNTGTAERNNHQEEIGQNPLELDDRNGSSTHCSRTCLLRVVKVEVYGTNGDKSVELAVFDECSTVSLIDNNLASKLKLSGHTDPLRLRWTNDDLQEDNNSQRVKLSISAVGGGPRFTLSNVRTMANLKLPVQPYNYQKLCDRWPYLREVQLPDMSNIRPRILLGQPHIHLTVARDIIEGPNPGSIPMLSNTKLGWVVHGPLGENSTEEFTFLACCQSDDDLLHDLVKESFKLEGAGVSSLNPRSREDELAEKKIEEVTRRVGDRWETGLLWKAKDEDVKLPRSYDVAIHRLRGVEGRFRRDPNLKQEYMKKLEHYLEKKYARKLTAEELRIKPNKHWLLPHFPTFHPNKPGKPRIVFDAASKSNGACLNDFLMTGPDLLVSLPGVLVKFRRKAIAFTGDITEMFHQVRIRPKDCAAQRFLFREDPSQPPDIYQLDVMMFGSVCSPFSAQYVKNRNAMEFETHFPRAVQAIVGRHYMDDYLDCCDTNVEAIQLISEVADIHSRGGFEIGKWVTNSPELQMLINPDVQVPEEKNFTDWAEVKTERVLGLHWNPTEDVFTFRVNTGRAGQGVADGSKRPTKREVLRLVMLIFDPLGFILHFTIKARILLQQIWRSSTGWDEEIPGEMWKRWHNWIGDIPKIADVKLPRIYAKNLVGAEDVQLHIMADASEAAMIAIAYLRVRNGDDIEVSFVMAKGKVAPLKAVSIPRLELQAAVIAAKLGSFLVKELDIKLRSTHYWTDSMTVLKWIRSDSRRYQQFVSHRLGTIHEYTRVEDWSWVPTKLNCADDATREGKTDLSSECRWWLGPEFLKNEETSWQFEVPKDLPPEELELKKEFVCVAVDEPTIIVPVVGNFSSYTRLVRVAARVYKYCEILLAKVMKKKLAGPHLPMEKAAKMIWKAAQWESFPEEMHQLSQGLPVGRKSKLHLLSPKLDADGVLRMESRLANVEEESLRAPVILPEKHPITKLLIHHYHVIALHNGQELVKNEIRQRFWIPHLRAAIRRCWSECRKCQKRRASPIPPIMGVLPIARIQQQSRPFTITGMDYFGPIEVSIGRRHEKRYGVLFTCMTTRAVWLEIADSLTTDSCIMAIRRLIARRGHPKEIFSDNGTNLRGADTELKKALMELDQEKITDDLSVKGIVWNFIPPAAPHMGGSWERLVRSVKTAMMAVLKSRYPKEEVLRTVMTEAEGIVNSRPLVDVPIDPGAPEALTPMHFLIGTSSAAQPPGKFDDRDLILTKKWRAAQRIADMFWQRWRKEYLPTLQRRAKWHVDNPNLAKDDIVILFDESLKRGDWPLGRILEVHPGKDGIVRVAVVKTQSGVYTRPVVKMAKLDVGFRSEIGGKDVPAEDEDCVDA